MENQKEFQMKGNTWVVIALFVVALVVAYIIIKNVIRLLFFLAPVILIAALIIDHKVFVGYVKMLVSLVKRNVLVGAGAIVLSLIGYPIVFTYLLIRALINKKYITLPSRQGGAHEEEMADFEELPNKSPRVKLPDENTPGGDPDKTA